jgi:hypothetical protein
MLRAWGETTLAASLAFGGRVRTVAAATARLEREHRLTERLAYGVAVGAAATAKGVQTGAAAVGKKVHTGAILAAKTAKALEDDYHVTDRLRVGALATVGAVAVGAVATAKGVQTGVVAVGKGVGRGASAAATAASSLDSEFQVRGRLAGVVKTGASATAGAVKSGAKAVAAATGDVHSLLSSPGQAFLGSLSGWCLLELEVRRAKATRLMGRGSGGGGGG